MDSTLKHHQRTDQARAEVERYRAGEPTRGPLLWAADFWETPAEALEALRSGAWQPLACGFCNGVGWTGNPTPGAKPNTVDCPLCLETGLSWSEQHAGLAAYAGCESLRPKISGYVWSVGDNYPLPEWLSYLPDWGTVPPVVAALGVVREWLFEIGPGDPNRTLAAWNVCKDALDAVERWCYWPSEEHRAACFDLVPSDSDPRSRTPTVALIAALPPSTAEAGDAIRRAMRAGLPEATAAQAARDEVRRWALVGLRG